MRRTTITALVFATTLTLLLGACRPEPGAPDYASQEAFDFDRNAPEVVFLPGPDPFVRGTQRLSLGLFYEGGASQTITVDGVTRNYFIYSDESTGVPTFSQDPTEERLEGLNADQIIHAGGPWWGGGVHWDVPQDLSLWRTLNISLNSEDPAFADMDLAMESANGVGLVKASSFGFVNDGQWHTLAIPLSTFAEQGVDLNAVTIALRIGGNGGMEGERALVDNLYLTP